MPEISLRREKGGQERKLGGAVRPSLPPVKPPSEKIPPETPYQ
jgi:hypothetical protein